MFRTIHRKCRRFYLSLARARATLKLSKRHSERQDWLQTLSTNRLLVFLWLLAAGLYTAHASYSSNSECGSELTRIAAGHRVEADVQPTGSIKQTEPTSETSSLRAATQQPQASAPPALPSAWGIKVIEPEALRQGWLSGRYLSAKQSQQAALPGDGSQTAPSSTAISEEIQPSPTAKDVRRPRAWKRRHARHPPIQFRVYPGW
jgi:hypothetical protein